MPGDPRQAMADAANVEPPEVQRAPILLAGQDAMDEDEDVDMPLQQLPISSSLSVGIPSGPGGYEQGLAAGDGRSVELISTIITPSPFAHHVAGPTSSRFRNALGRIQEQPTSDTEAWQALITEVNTCFRNLKLEMEVHSRSAESQLKLDWIESCYGTLLKCFPYASHYYVTIVEMLLVQSARVGEEDGPAADYGLGVSQRSVLCQAKLERLFEKVLGIHMDGSPVEEPPAFAYNDKVDVFASAEANGDNQGDEDIGSDNPSIGGMCTPSAELWSLYIQARTREAKRQAKALNSSDAARSIREWTVQAYETALTYAAFGVNNHLVWKPYIAFVRTWVTQSPPPLPGAALPPPVDHALQQKQMLQLRSIYQRLVLHPMTGLDQLWLEYEKFERSQNEQLAQSLIGEYMPKYQNARNVYLERNRLYSTQGLQMDRLAISPTNSDEDDYSVKLEEEYGYLKVWKTRVAYERTNPEALETGKDIAQRIRQVYKEMGCVLTRHPEVWHMWAMWELHSGGGEGKESERAHRALKVLDLALEHIPDCTLLGHTQAQIVESYTSIPSMCLPVMEYFVERVPTTLGYVLYQQLVRRYKGVKEARAVFAKARRVLDSREEGATAKQDQAATAEEGETDIVTNENEATEAKDDARRRMVTNRLDASIGTTTSPGEMKADPSAPDTNGAATGDETAVIKPGRIAWQLYASHATIEHRLNNFPEVAARVFELGLRKHASFLTKPAYVMRYAQLLLELNDTVNLRALLTRAVSACEGQEERSSAVAALWDMTLRFESLLSGADPTNISAFHAVERRRREALMGPDEEDVATGGVVGAADAPTIGNQKSSLAENLVRADGYDVSSQIVSGMSRMVDVLGVMGLWGDGSGGATLSAIQRRQGVKMEIPPDDEIPGGKSDTEYQRRMHFSNLAASGISADSAFDGGGAGVGGAAGSKLLSARDRLQQAGPAQNTAMAMAIQQMPEWVRPMLVLLPMSRSRLPVVTKPPPHLTEMALNALRQSNLPAERPPDGSGTRKRKVGGNHKTDGGDSSDEDDGPKTSGGYGAQYRKRRARQIN